MPLEQRLFIGGHMYINIFFSLFFIVLGSYSFYVSVSDNEYKKLIDNYGEISAKKRKFFLKLCGICLWFFAIVLLILTIIK